MILDDPFDDPRGLDVPSRSPVPTKELISVIFQHNAGFLVLLSFLEFLFGMSW